MSSSFTFALRLAIIPFAVSLVACASSSKTCGPDGRVAYSIDCSGLVGTWGACYEKAGDLCGAAGYDVMTRDSDQNLVFGGGGRSFGGGTAQSRSLLIACKTPNGVAAR
jgi:hypothetical protein